MKLKLLYYSCQRGADIVPIIQMYKINLSFLVWKLQASLKQQNSVMKV